ncbi:MAG TPA: patatin-like phospholipase family protein, partial [Candidatus Saccharimonadales bacterium]|nr:patatin-like phospholipase family protein [Candidatus Saccharimonadales bacterium]
MQTLLDELVAHQKNRKDKRKFGLVIQGGGMRGCYAAGALVPFWELGLIDSFDHVIGSSAGAINGAYFLGADKDSAYIYLNDLTNKNFVDLLRRGKKIDVDYAVDMVITHKRPINIERLKAAHPKLHVVVTNANNGRREVISDHKDLELLY